MIVKSSLPQHHHNIFLAGEDFGIIGWCAWLLESRVCVFLAVMHSCLMAACRYLNVNRPFKTHVLVVLLSDEF